jgi:hypothetical protein
MPTPLEQLNQLDPNQINSSGLQGLMNMIKAQEPNPIQGNKAEGMNGVQPTPPSIKPQQFKMNLPSKFPVMSYETRMRLFPQASQPGAAPQGLSGLMGGK